MRGVQLLFVLFGAAIATIAPFVSVMLHDRGMEPAAIGLVSSVSALGFTLAVPVWGHLGDVTLGRVRALQVAAVGSGVAFVFFNLPLPGFLLGAMVVWFTVFESAMGPLADALAVGVIGDRPELYGRIRMLNSLAYAVVVIPVGLLYDRIGFAPVPFIWLASCVVLVAGVSTIREPARRRPPVMHGRGGSARVALEVQPRLPLVLAVFGIVFLALLGAINFLYIHITELGGGPSDIALAGGLSALAEVPGMVAAAAIARRIGLRGLFFISAAGYSACMFAWGIVNEPVLIIATRTASGLPFAGLWVACVLTINVLLPQRLQATGQALFQTIAFGVGAMIGTAIGGIVYQGAGPAVLFIGAAAIGAAGAIGGWLVLPRTRDLRGAPDIAEPEPVNTAVPEPVG